MTNKLLSKEKEEQRAELEEGNRMNIAMKRNIKEVTLFDGVELEQYFKPVTNKTDFVSDGRSIGIQTKSMDYQSTEN